MLRRSSASRLLAQRSVAAAVAACFGATVAAQPAGLSVRHGSASIQQQAGRTTVTTGNGAGSRHSALDWRSFQVPGGHTVFFSQPDARSTSINRVTGGNPSTVLGTLASNGRLVLVNPAGIAVAPGAVVDTAGFTASTLGMTARDAMAGRLRFGDGATAGGPLQVQGRVLARGGDVMLLGAQVETGGQAVVRAVDGDVVLAAGRQVEITGRGIEGIHLQVKAPQDRAVNLGTLAGDSVAMFAGQLRHSGLVQAGSATAAGGRVVLEAGVAAEVSGAIRAAGPDRGGSVHLTADVLVLKASASIDVRHARGGGEILVGGGWQGQDARIANARGVDVEQGVRLRADATLSGHGGTVVVWSDDLTRFRGTISARGAGAAGNGGRAEVSGRRQLIFRGEADLGAERGRTGDLLLDPETVTIRAGSGDGTDSTLSSTSLQDLLGLGEVGSSVLGANFTIYESEIEGTDANITIQAGSKIQVSGAFGGNELTVRPDRDLRLEVNGTGGGGIDLVGMPLRTQGNGKVRLETTAAGQDIRPDRISTGGGEVVLRAPDAQVFLGAPSMQGGAFGSSGKVKVEASAVYFAGTNTVAQEVEVKAPATNAGTLRVVDRGTIKVDAQLVNDGVIDVARGGDLHLEKKGTLFNQAGGLVQGSGRIELHDGSFINRGTVEPGGAGSVGTLEIRGSFNQPAGGLIRMEVAGPDSHDRLEVREDAVLGGSLEVTALGYVPTPVDSFQLVTAKSRTGWFEQVAASGFPGFAPVYGKGVTFAAAGAPAAPPAPTPAPAPSTGGPGTPAEPPSPAPPGSPTEPGQPATPAEPGTPQQPGTPGEPATPGQPATPTTPTTPGQPVPPAPGTPGSPPSGPQRPTTGSAPAPAAAQRQGAREVAEVSVDYLARRAPQPESSEPGPRKRKPVEVTLNQCRS